LMKAIERGTRMYAGVAIRSALCLNPSAPAVEQKGRQYEQAPIQLRTSEYVADL